MIRVRILVDLLQYNPNKGKLVMNSTKKAATLALMVFMVFMILVGPFLTIWSLNTLFGFSIGYSLKTWFAALFLSMAIGGTKFTTSK